MIPSATDTPEKRTISFGDGDFLAPAALIVGVLAFIAGNGLIHEDAYAEIGYALALLSAIGSVACLGYLFMVFRSLDFNLEVSFAYQLFTDRFANISTHGENWPLLVRMLFSPFVTLLSGLGGWVEVRFR